MSAGLQHPERPDFDRSLGTEERAQFLTELLLADAHLQAMVSAVGTPRNKWPAKLIERLAPSLLRGEPAEQQLRRWSTLFADEASLVHETRNRIVHQFGVSDAELLRAHWLASHLLSITFAESDRL
jgi:hypothetical protein